MSNLAEFINNKRTEKPILLMTHVIYGYPNIAQSLDLMKELLEQGVELLEVQFPFSDPVADGLVITNACHVALESQPKLSQCLRDISELAECFPQSRVLLMSYLNPLLQLGFTSLANEMAPHIAGIIVPDLPVDQHKMLAPLLNRKISPIWLITPAMQKGRAEQVAAHADGLVYCVSRRGVTGQTADTQTEQAYLNEYIKPLKQLTAVPLALGFGISSGQDVKNLVGLVDVAIVGSALLVAYQTGGKLGFKEKVADLMSLGKG